MWFFKKNNIWFHLDLERLDLSPTSQLIRKTGQFLYSAHWNARLDRVILCPTPFFKEGNLINKLKKNYVLLLKVIHKVGCSLWWKENYNCVLVPHNLSFSFGERRIIHKVVYSMYTKKFIYYLTFFFEFFFFFLSLSYLQERKIEKILIIILFSFYHYWHITYKKIWVNP